MNLYLGIVLITRSNICIIEKMADLVKVAGKIRAVITDYLAHSSVKFLACVHQSRENILDQFCCAGVGSHENHLSEFNSAIIISRTAIQPRHRRGPERVAKLVAEEAVVADLGGAGVGQADPPR